MNLKVWGITADLVRACQSAHDVGAPPLRVLWHADDLLVTREGGSDLSPTEEEAVRAACDAHGENVVYAATETTGATSPHIASAWWNFRPWRSLRGTSALAAALVAIGAGDGAAADAFANELLVASKELVKLRCSDLDRPLSVFLGAVYPLDLLVTEVAARLHAERGAAEVCFAAREPAREPEATPALRDLTSRELAHEVARRARDLDPASRARLQLAANLIVGVSGDLLIDFGGGQGQ